MITMEHPLRHPFQAMVSLGQIYGDILYYATSMFDLYHKGLNYSRPEPYYFWCYYFFMNFIWIVIPSSRIPLHLLEYSRLMLVIVLLYSSTSRTEKAFQALARENKQRQTNGGVKKHN